MIMLLPIKWAAAIVLAAAVHEAGHMAAIILMGGEVLAVRVGGNGTVIETNPLSARAEFVSALAGPLSGGILLLFSRWIPRTAVCAGFQSVYNLLPIYPLDGGRALRCLLGHCLQDTSAEKITGIMSRVCAAGIVLLAVYGVIYCRAGLFCVIFASVLLWKTRKMSCKEGAQRVQ